MLKKIESLNRLFPETMDMPLDKQEALLAMFNDLMCRNPDITEQQAYGMSKEIVAEIEEEAGLDYVYDFIAGYYFGGEDECKQYNPPKAVKANAAKALESSEQLSEVKRLRAKHLSSGKPISLMTVKCMAQSSRHRDPKLNSSLSNNAEDVAYLAWGGSAGTDWAMRIANQEAQEGINEQVLHTLSTIQLDEGKASTIEVLRAGVLHDRGLEIKMSDLQQYVANFNKDVYGTEIQVNLSHDRDGEAAGWIKDLYIDGDSLMAKVEWTPLGEEKIVNKLFKFVSAELATVFKHWRTGEKVRNVFIGAGLTNVPAMKGQQPIALSEDLKLLFNQNNMFKHMLATLKGKDTISLEAFELLKGAYEQLSEEEQEEVKAEVEEVEAKVEETPETPEIPEEEAGEEDEEKDEEKETEELSEKGQFVSLSEYNKLKEKIERQELSELVINELSVSKSRPTGFIGAQTDKVVDFMLSLSADQREQFKELVSDIRSVELSTIGSTNTKPVSFSDEETEEDKLVKLAEQNWKSGKFETFREAQDAAMAELNL